MKNLALLFLILANTVFAQEQVDILLKNGRVIDGTGNSWFYGDVAVTKGKITAVGKLSQVAANKIIDATGLIIAPGFIDVHTHIEGDEINNPTADNFIYDGVTTVITGNCGASRVKIGEYFRMLDSLRTSINVATLIGHNDIRRAVMGNSNRDPNESELQKMETLVEEAMQQGAVGLSTGLIYIPGTYSKTGEILRLAKVAAKYDGIYASHMRNESDSVVQAINEALYIGRSANLPVEISHFKVSGQQNWGRSKETIALIENARLDGIDVTIDQYPYTASSTSLSTMIPDEILADGMDSVRARLQTPAIRKYVIGELLKSSKKRRIKHFNYAVVAYHRADTTLNGKSIEEINLLKGRKHKAKFEAETIIDLMINGGAGMVFHGMSEEDVKRIMKYPYNMIASDASIRIFNQGVPHPRGYGTNARILAKYVRDEKVLSLEEAIRRMTSLPAQKFRLYDRGILKPGMAADIVVFNEKDVQDLSTFEKPHQYARGFRFVLVNGELVLENGKHNGIRSGKPVYGQYVTSNIKKT
ncbi:MAG: N-acyl-D-amino-acid deacylase family protein [Flavitalea sp.]